MGSLQCSPRPLAGSKGAYILLRGDRRGMGGENEPREGRGKVNVL